MSLRHVNLFVGNTAYISSLGRQGHSLTTTQRQGLGWPEM